ncbi:helix-turn-helix transcriptional regulator [Flavilitoribacter nigricans]|uniref:AraC family transcriptional regulator n=1 Tax=Flavilitoribacter nigricans (strain ATCC 23147 / DSM 23189 / NBRC 102662 / NCIMB 1420 / SS-2) TaxID=1122177 RepID=A0A2D0N362_FLAN2|nr:AraC family transcriptional regulator [Flavilitoribacter nigricans]PHN02826.1 AraC family transcriptional regulator [Flavilitoribacter nigricans DSM 23189 = NBRC 102662]
MIIIPQRLFSDPQVQVILRDGNVCILQKKLTEPIREREGYISNHVISLLLAGEQHLRTFDDETIRVQAGEILFIPRGLYYISDLLPEAGAFGSLLFYFDDRIIQEFLSVSRVDEFNRDRIPTHLKCKAPPAISLFARSLLGIYQQNGIRQKQFLDLKILELLHLLNGQVPSRQFADFLFRLTLPKKRNIRHFMQQNFDKPLKIEDYAYLTGRSPSSFRRDFKQFFATTPQKWIKQKRLEKARSLLEEQSSSVADLAFAVGYENVSYFIKEFKDAFGISPKQLQLSQEEKKEK